MHDRKISNDNIGDEGAQGGGAGGGRDGGGGGRGGGLLSEALSNRSVEFVSSLN